MIRKITAYGFMLLASMVLLAHTVIPHHHHQSVACFESTHCHDHDQNDQNENTTGNHRHDDDSSSNECILKQVVALTSTQEKLIKVCVRHSDNLINGFAIASDSGAAIQASVSFPVNLVPDSDSYLFPAATIPLGLRAPPAVWIVSLS